MRIKVPATSANLGPGFDSCGIALSLYLNLEISRPSDKWFIEHELGDSIPSDETNLIISTALKIVPDLQPHYLRMLTKIPSARGLGSSSSAIVAGIELADCIANLGMSKSDKIRLASQMEGHPDNVAPAICGNFVVASMDEEDVFYSTHRFPLTDIVAFIPSTELLTTESRNVLPEIMPFKEAVKASSIANVMVGAIINSDIELAGKMMSLDLFHESYREPLVPHLSLIREIGEEYEAYATVLSGAGPTVLTFISSEKSEEFMEALKGHDDLVGDVSLLGIDSEGTQVF